MLRIEPARRKREDKEFECVAENGVGDPVSAKATLDVLDGKGQNDSGLFWKIQFYVF